MRLFSTSAAVSYILGVKTRGGACDLEIQTRLRFLYSAPTTKFIILCLIDQKLSCWQTNKQQK